MADTNGAIYGIVSEEGSIKVDNPVVLMDHATLSIIAKTKTDIYGGYMFNNLDPDKTDYMVFTVDNDGVEPKNALIKDYVTPIKTANGTVDGDFLGYLDALAPAMSGVPVFRGGGQGTRVHMARPAGGSTATGTDTDYGGISSWTDTTAAPAAGTTPIPTNPSIRGFKLVSTKAGWINRLRSQYGYVDGNIDAECPRVSQAAALTMFFTHKTNGQHATYAVCNAHQPNYSERPIYSRDAGGVFWPDNGYYYPGDTFFNVTINTTGELRLRWLVDNNGVPNTGSKRDLLVTTLTNDKWYAVAVRYGLHSDPILVDVLDVDAGTVATYTMAALGSLNKHQYYGSNWGEGEPFRFGFLVYGENQLMSGWSFNNWDSNGGYSWKGVINPSATGVISGPWAYWNRKLSDAETAKLLDTVWNTESAERVLPRFVSEIHSKAPFLYMPFDDSPMATPRVSKQGQKVDVTYVRGTNPKTQPFFSGRRRLVTRNGVARRLQCVTPPHWDRGTYIVFFNNNIGSTANGNLINVTGCENDQWKDNNQDYTYHTIYMSLESGGVPRFYWRNGGNGYQDCRWAAGPLANAGLHMFAVVADPYTGLKHEAFVDGVSVGTIATGQTNLRTMISGASAMYTVHQQIGFNADFGGGQFRLTGKGLTEHTAITPTDVAIYTGCLSAAEIAEIYAAWVIAVGTDSHA